MESRSLDGLKRLYAIIDHTSCSKKGITPLSFAKAFFNAGGDIIQYRNKESSLDGVTKEIELLVKEITMHKKILIVNDYPQIAQKFGISFHLGQEDFKKYTSRGGNKQNRQHCISRIKSFSPESFTGEVCNDIQTWGLSTHNIDEVQIAIKHNPTYIGFGSIFQSKTKEALESHFKISEKNLGTALDTTFQKVLCIWKKPIVLIGGICLENIHWLPQESRIFYAVIQDFFRHGNSTTAIEQYTHAFLAKLDTMKF